MKTGIPDDVEESIRKQFRTSPKPVEPVNNEEHEDYEEQTSEQTSKNLNKPMIHLQSLLT